MKTKARKNVLNVPLKVACIQTRHTQRKLAGLMRIPEARFSDIVRGKGVPATEQEQAAIVRVLNRYDGVDVTIADLFPASEEAIAS